MTALFVAALCNRAGHYIFAQLTAESTYTLQWAAPPPSKLSFRMGGSGLPSKTWFLGPTWVYNPNGISIGSVVFAGLTTDRQTDRPTDRQTTLLLV